MKFKFFFLLASAIFYTVTTTKDAHDATLPALQNITIQAFTGQEAKKYLNDIARIRINLFSEYPYLYKGNFVYEQEYLETYFQSGHADILLVFDGDNIVGFSNSIPLTEEFNEIKAPFIQNKLPLNDYLYVGEAMLYPQYRGKGILRKFSEFHENKARCQKYKYIIFMTVERPDDHPCKPENYSSPDTIWKHFGYEKIPNLHIQLAWQQVDTNQETDNRLAIWQKEIK